MLGARAAKKPTDDERRAPLSWVCPACGEINDDGQSWTCADCGKQKPGVQAIDGASATRAPTKTSDSDGCPHCGGALQIASAVRLGDATGPLTVTVQTDDGQGRKLEVQASVCTECRRVELIAPGL